MVRAISVRPTVVSSSYSACSLSSVSWVMRWISPAIAFSFGRETTILPLRLEKASDRVCDVEPRTSKLDQRRRRPVSNERTHRVAVIGGDGIGPEVTAAALDVVRAAGVTITTTSYDLGAGRYLRDGFVLDDATLEELRGFDAIMLGAVGPAIGDTRIPGGVLERGLLLRLRFGLDLYINYRPFHGVAGSIAQGCDFAIVRENTEGPYAGEGGVLRRGTPYEIATQGSVNTRFGVERCVRYAFERAASLASPRLTLVHKTNVLTFAGDLWSRVVA